MRTQHKAGSFAVFNIAFERLQNSQPCDSVMSFLSSISQLFVPHFATRPHSHVFIHNIV